jgi:hypothetical protein
MVGRTFSVSSAIGSSGSPRQSGPKRVVIQERGDDHPLGSAALIDGPKGLYPSVKRAGALVVPDRNAQRSPGGEPRIHGPGIASNGVA